MTGRKLKGLLIELKNTALSRHLWLSVSGVTLLGCTFPATGAVLDRLFQLFQGPGFDFMYARGLPMLMAWMISHTLLSVLIGKETEVLLDCIQYRLPRYKSPLSFWRFNTVKTAVVCGMYYLILFAAVILSSWALGERMPGVSAALTKARQIDLDDTALLIGALYLRAALPMYVLLLLQSLLHFATRSALPGGVAFVGLTAASALIPPGTLSRYLPGNWMVFERSVHVLPQEGVDAAVIFYGYLVIFLIVQAAAWAVFRRKQWY